MTVRPLPSEAQEGPASTALHVRAHRGATGGQSLSASNLQVSLPALGGVQAVTVAA